MIEENDNYCPDPDSMYEEQFELEDDTGEFEDLEGDEAHCSLCGEIFPKTHLNDENECEECLVLAQEDEETE